jgi:hypothetical protein
MGEGWKNRLDKNKKLKTQKLKEGQEGSSEELEKLGKQIVPRQVK